MKAVAVIAAASISIGALSVSADRADGRKATKSERAAIMNLVVTYSERNWDEPEPPRCFPTWIIRVSQSKPRLAAIATHSTYRARLKCQPGDGFMILQRPKPKSIRWRIIMQGSGSAPSCRLTPPKVSRQLGFGGECS